MTGRRIPSAHDRTVEHRRPTRSEIAHARTVAERLQAAREAARARLNDPFTDAVRATIAGRSDH